MKTHPPNIASSKQEDARRRGHYLAAAAAVLFSTSPILIRSADTISALEIAWWRLLLATLTVLVISTITRQEVHWRALFRKQFAIYRLTIALHFFFTASLSFTTVAHTLALAYRAPVFIALFSFFIIKEHPTPSRGTGIALGLIGAAILAGFEPEIRPHALLGDALAIEWGAAWLTPLALWAAQGSNYDAAALGTVVCLGIVPLGMGHTLYNAALRRAPATDVNLIATGEVFGGVLLSAIFLGEYPTLVTLSGGAVLILGIGLVIR